MKTDDLEKGTMILLNNGWKAKLVDNRHGQIRYAEVYGDYTETGSIYSHDIVGYYSTKGTLKKVGHSERQKICAKMTAIFGL